MDKKIKFEMIPENMWYCNLRHILSKSQWDIIRKDAYQKSNEKCMICNRKVKRLEAHELWNFNEITQTQSLTDVIALCSICHKTIHIGHASIIGKLEECFKNYCKINKCSIEECLTDYKKAFDLWNERNKINWILDLEWLEENYNIRKEI